MKPIDYLYCGYKDAQERDIYKRLPKDVNIELPFEVLSKEAKLYFSGFEAGMLDGIAKTFKKVNHEPIR